MFVFLTFFDIWMLFLIFITKNTNANVYIFFDFVNVFNFDWKIYIFTI